MAQNNYESQLFRDNYIQGVLDKAFPILDDAPENEIEQMMDMRQKLRPIMQAHFPLGYESLAKQKMAWALDTLRIAMEAVEKQL